MFGVSISILIITDRKRDWATFLSSEINYNYIIEETRRGFELTTELFRISIVDSAEQCGRRRYSDVILDKHVSNGDMRLIRSIATQARILHADGYFEGEEADHVGFAF